MRDDVFVYLVKLPEGVDEVVMPCANGCYTVYIDASLSLSGQREAYLHALHHINNRDFEKSDVQQIESEAHGRW